MKVFGSACYVWVPPTRGTLGFSLASIVRGWLARLVHLWFFCFCRLTVVRGEPWWHRRLRRTRSVIRTAFNTGGWTKWSTKRISRAVQILSSHHGSQVPDRVLRQISIHPAPMETSAQWTCRFCTIRQPVTNARCKSCSRHWKQAQVVSTSRSMSRKQRQKRQNTQNAQTNSMNKDGKDHKDNGGGQSGELFEGNHPWVMSSPQARTMMPMASAPAEAEDTEKMPIPPEAKSSPAPETNPDEILTHLRGLKKAMGQLPAALEEPYQTLEAQAKDRMLSHGHINKLGRLQKQLTSLSTRIAQMDKDWKGFAEKVLSKFSQHQEMYRQSRASLMEDFLKKSQEIQEAKQEVQQASLTLFNAQTPPPPPPIEELDAAEVMEEALREDVYMDMEEEEDTEEVSTRKKELKSAALTPFRPRSKLTSPSKVHAGHLKQKDT